MVAGLCWGCWLWGGCAEEREVGAYSWGGFTDCPGPQFSSDFTKPDLHEVDLLFVIDNSGSMAMEQDLLFEQFGTLMQQLRQFGYRLPDIHVGVTSTDLGIDPYVAAGCDTPGGDQGRLLRQDWPTCVQALEGNYIVDVQPVGCEITRDEEALHCVSHDCTAVSCAHEPLTSLVLDEHGCPRCVNYHGEDLETAFRCLALVGIHGCGFEQPLEAMRRALDNNPANAGFLREDSYLAVVVISDEDDCSTRDGTVLFNFDDTEIDSPLGPATSFRCFEFGFRCEPEDATRMELGPRVDCVERDDPGALLIPVAEYVSFLEELRPPERLMVAAIAGPVAPDHSVEVTLYDSEHPYLAYSCDMGPGTDGAYPALRLHSFVERFHHPSDMAWAFTSSCSEDYRASLEGIGSVIRSALDARCPAIPLAGCADPGASVGAPYDEQTCNDHCEARCELLEVYDAGQPTEHTVELPPCLEVCPQGPCPGNDQPALAYAGGMPSQRDPSLPVEACWYVAHNPDCAASRGGEVRVARRAEPSGDHLLEVQCQMAPATEQCCYDGIDNDLDCLVDLEDPDCAGQSPPGYGPDPPGGV